MNEILQKQIEERSTLNHCSIDGKTRIWVSKENKIDYNELHRIMVDMNKTINGNKG